MGLYVCITSDPNNPEDIDSITVSAEWPKVQLVRFDVRFSLERVKVGDMTTPTLRKGDNMIDLPTKA